MVLHELQPAIWPHVVSFLKRQSPPIKTECRWDELHPHDLTVAARLSVVSGSFSFHLDYLTRSITYQSFNQAASNVLYRHPVVDSLESFFHILSVPPTIRNSPDKSQLLAKVRSSISSTLTTEDPHL